MANELIDQLRASNKDDLLGIEDSYENDIEDEEMTEDSPEKRSSSKKE